MKPLLYITGVERARILHQLFPDEIPALLDFIAGMCITIKEEGDRNRKAFANPIITFDSWLVLLNEVETKIQQYGKKLHSSPRLFADQLFDGYLAMYTGHCLMTYTSVRIHPNKKFTQAVELFFYP